MEHESLKYQNIPNKKNKKPGKDIFKENWSRFLLKYTRSRAERDFDNHKISSCELTYYFPTHFYFIYPAFQRPNEMSTMPMKQSHVVIY